MAAKQEERRALNFFFCPLIKILFYEYNFFLMYSINFFFPIGCPGVGGCPNPGACWAYPRAGPAHSLIGNHACQPLNQPSKNSKNKTLFQRSKLDTRLQTLLNFYQTTQLHIALVIPYDVREIASYYGEIIMILRAHPNQLDCDS